MSCKVVRKLDPMEKVGVLARANAETLVIEYTELTDECRHARDANGELRFWAGNMALHVFSLPFLRRVAGAADRWLRFHASEKKIPTVDDQGRPVAPRGAERPQARALRLRRAAGGARRVRGRDEPRARVCAGEERRRPRLPRDGAAGA